jgi:hypothetical protein
MNSKKIIIEIELQNKIFIEKQQIINELNIILNQINGYKYNKKKDKIKKHFCKILNIAYDDINIKNPHSISLSSKNIHSQLLFIFNEANMRFNFINALNNYGCILCKNYYNINSLTLVDLRNLLNKYEGLQIKNKFPEFFINNRIMYDTVYTIHAPNNMYYIHLNKQKFCNTILVCIKNKIINIMFDLEKDKIFYSYLEDINLDETLIKYFYNNIDF